MARPRKYSEKTTVISAVVPLSVLELLDKQRGKMTRSEYIASLIVSADKDLAMELKREIEHWKQKANELEKQLKETREKMDRLMQQTRKIKANAVNYIFELPEIPEIDEVVSAELPRIRTRLQKQLDSMYIRSEEERNQTIMQILSDESRILAKQLELKLATNGRAVKNRKILEKAILKHLATVF